MGIAKRIGAGLCLAVAANAVQAERWYMAGKNDNETRYIDGDTIKRDESGNVLVWTKSDFSRHPMVIDGKSVATLMQRDAFDCARDRSAIVSSVTYGRNGAVLTVIDPPSPVFEEIPPGTIIASIEHIACDVAKLKGM